MLKILYIQELHFSSSRITIKTNLKLIFKGGLMFLKNNILMCPPLFYGLRYKINKFMDPENKQVNQKTVFKQWFALYSVLLKVGCRIHLIEQHPKFPDMVFTANCALSYNQKIILGNFRFPERQGEKKFLKEEFLKIKKLFGYQFKIIELPKHIISEGQGEVVIANKKLIAGWGPGTKGEWFRTNPESIEYLARILNLKPLILEMEDPWLYHLDTCFCLVNPTTAFFAPHAFSIDSIKKIKKEFPFSEEISLEEAHNFACNTIIAGSYAIIPYGNKKASKKLEKRGKRVIEIQMSEFIKAGGACKCLVFQW